ncbi:NADPH:quinone oxidoreductase family protein [Hirschia baltica]|uniref:Alcohol dehydrogenase zinc-binding domain protein n=1 Tax=Hirschia baltica (strain ATCC 49814 / DSM 5838 / IFAM 1418) TaxID=582402 RepID=C6XQY7_HIRBI|nr:NADPH:quinone oxidoreductase family protein [Hirschia baltica]ACT60518.1 Alcohol dehydrogenase zinc-binding domain protein [Hirschia baltica ATCC 49814]
MKALVSKTPGGPDSLELVELPKPDAAANELVVRIHACGVNFPDSLVIEDRYQFKPPRPFAPGSEIAGVVEKVGENTSGWEVGDRVVATVPHGGFAEYISVPENLAFPLPADKDFNQASALLLVYGTTYHALADRGNLKPGETLLVLGAAGGVGLAAIELGKAMGARVVAAVSSEDKAQAAKDAGADDTIVYARQPFDKAQSKELAKQFKDVLGSNGADVIYDPVGGDYCEPALRACAWEGRYLVIGFAAGIPSPPLNLTLLKGCDIRGVFWGAFTARSPEKNLANVNELMRLWGEGKINPKVGKTWPLEKGGDAIQWLVDRKAIGKVVVTID